MKKVVLSHVLLLFCGMYLFAQDKQDNSVVRIKAGADPATAYSPHGFYRYPVFNEGVAYMKNGDKTIARFNYHILNQEVHFLSNNGDTLALGDPLSLKYITIDSNLYYYSEGYLEVISGRDPVKLARKLRLDVRPEKIGAYGQASPSGSIRTPNRLILGNNSSNLTINQDLVVQKHYSYYWLDQYSTVLKATKANFLKLVSPDKKNAVEDYLKKNKVEFHNEEDLKKLLQFSLATK